MYTRRYFQVIKTCYENQFLSPWVKHQATELIPRGQALVITSQRTISLQSSLEKLKPYPKAAARKTARGRQQQCTRILTDSHVINEICMRQENKKKSQPVQETNKKKHRLQKSTSLIKQKSRVEQ